MKIFSLRLRQLLLNMFFSISLLVGVYHLYLFIVQKTKRQKIQYQNQLLMKTQQKKKQSIQLQPNNSCLQYRFLIIIIYTLKNTKNQQFCLIERQDHQMESQQMQVTSQKQKNNKAEQQVQQNNQNQNQYVQKTKGVASQQKDIKNQKEQNNFNISNNQKLSGQQNHKATNKKLRLEQLTDHKEEIQYYEYIRTMTQTNQLAYWIGNPSVQIISGNIILEPLKKINVPKQPENYQLYLEYLRKSNFSQNEQNKNQQDQKELNSLEERKNDSQIHNNKRKNHQIHNRTLILCGIPNSKSPIQVMQTQQIAFLRQQIIQVRVIKTARIKYYAMLLLFKDTKSAGIFYNQLFGQEYTSLEMERILLREMKQISLSFTELNKQGNTENQMLLLRQLKKDQNFIEPENIFMTYHHQKLKGNEKHQNNQIKESDEPPSPSALTCAICFQQCQNQVISILCGHYFDIKCLQRWSQNICPLCRYHQQPPIIKFCELCNQCQGLWICLICGSRLCCGISNDILALDSHIYSHFKQQGHSLSMQLQTKFLFDARIPAFLHKKFYSDLMKSNQKQESLINENKKSQSHKKDKLTKQIQQYENKVGQQMKSQRGYFQQQINRQIYQYREVLNNKRQLVQKLKTEINQLDLEENNSKKMIEIHNENIKKSQSQIQIAKNLQKMLQKKRQQKKKQFGNLSQLKKKRLRELDELIMQKKDQLKNYMQNMNLKERLIDKLKNETVSSQIVFEVDENSKQKKNKKKR